MPPTCTDGHNLVNVTIVVLGGAADFVGHPHRLLTFVLLRLAPEILDLLLRQLWAVDQKNLPDRDKNRAALWNWAPGNIGAVEVQCGVIDHILISSSRSLGLSTEAFR